MFQVKEGSNRCYEWDEKHKWENKGAYWSLAHRESARCSEGRRNPISPPEDQCWEGQGRSGIHAIRLGLRSSIRPILQKVWAPTSMDDEALEFGHGLLQFRLSEDWHQDTRRRGQGARRNRSWCRDGERFRPRRMLLKERIPMSLLSLLHRNFFFFFFLIWKTMVAPLFWGSIFEEQWLPPCFEALVFPYFIASLFWGFCLDQLAVFASYYNFSCFYRRDLDLEFLSYKLVTHTNGVFHYLRFKLKVFIT